MQSPAWAMSQGEPGKRQALQPWEHGPSREAEPKWGSKAPRLVWWQEQRLQQRPGAHRWGTSQQGMHGWPKPPEPLSPAACCSSCCAPDPPRGASMFCQAVHTHSHRLTRTFRQFTSHVRRIILSRAKILNQAQQEGPEKHQKHKMPPIGGTWP